MGYRGKQPRSSLQEPSLRAALPLPNQYFIVTSPSCLLFFPLSWQGSSPALSFIKGLDYNYPN